MSEERVLCYDHKVDPDEVPTFWLKELCPECLRSRLHGANLHIESLTLSYESSKMEAADLRVLLTKANERIAVMERIIGAAKCTIVIGSDHERNMAVLEMIDALFPEKDEKCGCISPRPGGGHWASCDLKIQKPEPFYCCKDQDDPCHPIGGYCSRGRLRDSRPEQGKEE